MKLILSPTAEIVVINDAVAVRVWEGHSESGAVVRAYVAAIEVAESADRSEFERELRALPPPLEEGGRPLKILQ